MNLSQNAFRSSSTIECWIARDANHLAQLACNLLKQTLAVPEDELAHGRDKTQSALPAVALSGGSTPKKLYEFITSEETNNPIWHRAEWFWSDERNVPLDHSDSNFGMAKQFLLDPLRIPSQRIHPVPIQIHQPSKAAADYEAKIRAVIPQTRQGQPIFRLIFLGLGDDAHTASLFPHTTALQATKLSVVSNHVPKLATDRITFTAPLINAADIVVFLVSGATKRDALNYIWHGRRDSGLYPAQLIQGVRRLVWIVDRGSIGETPPPENSTTTVF